MKKIFNKKSLKFNVDFKSTFTFFIYFFFTKQVIQVTLR